MSEKTVGQQIKQNALGFSPSWPDIRRPNEVISVPRRTGIPMSWREEEVKTTWMGLLPDPLKERLFKVLDAPLARTTVSSNLEETEKVVFKGYLPEVDGIKNKEILLGILERFGLGPEQMAHLDAYCIEKYAFEEASLDNIPDRLKNVSLHQVLLDIETDQGMNPNTRILPVVVSNFFLELCKKPPIEQINPTTQVFAQSLRTFSDNFGTRVYTTGVDGVDDYDLPESELIQPLSRRGERRSGNRKRRTK